MRPGIGKIFPVISVFLAVWLAAKFLLPLFGPFFLGTLLALAAEPMTAFLHRRLRLPRAAASGIAVTAAFCFLAILLLLACAFLIRELQALAGTLPHMEEAVHSGIRLTRDWLLEMSGRLPQSLRPLLQENIGTVFSDGSSLVSRAVSWLLSLAGNLLSHVPDSAFGLGTAVVSGYMISGRLPRIIRTLRRRIPRQKLRQLAQTAARIRSTLGRWLLAQGKLMGLTFLILLSGFVILRIPYAPVWAAAICLVDAFPILGTGSVLLPWSLILLLRGDGARALGMAGIYVTVALSRSVAEPKLLGHHLGMDPLVTLMALYAGYRLWGIGGMLLSPILTTTALQLLPERK